MKLMKPQKGSIFFEDKKLYACLASHPITYGHSIVVWKSSVSDLHLLSKKDYEHLMNSVDLVRNALLKALKLKKVYLVYMDEVKQVHWHLIPRFNEQGFNILVHKPKLLHDVSLVGKIKNYLPKK